MKSAQKRNSDFYESTKPYLKIQRILKAQSKMFTLTELKAMSRSDLKDNLSVDESLLKIIFDRETIIQTVSETQTESVSDNLEQTKSEIQVQTNNSNEQTDQTQTETQTETQTQNETTTKLLNEFTGIDIVYPNWKNKMQDVSIAYMERNNEIDFIIRHSMNTDKITVLCGESGIGKTLLCKTISKVFNTANTFFGGTGLCPG